jgi:hypothetical protein
MCSVVALYLRRIAHHEVLVDKLLTFFLLIQAKIGCLWNGTHARRLLLGQHGAFAISMKTVVWVA